MKKPLLASMALTLGYAVTGRANEQAPSTPLSQPMMQRLRHETVNWHRGGVSNTHALHDCNVSG